MSVALIDVLTKEAARTGLFLEGLALDDWTRPTRCPPMNLLELAVHTLRGGLRLVELIGKPAAGEPEKDAATYFQYDAAATGAGVVERAQTEAKTRTGPGLVAEWASAWAAAISLAEANLEDDPVIPSPLGTIRLHEYIRTRCVEVTIHAMDLRDAMGIGPDPTPEGLDATCDVLRGMLGADLRPLGVDEVRFALTGTGRAKLTDAEREVLGPLADLFPLLQ